ncbi:MAG: hypothetical protein JWO86_1378 [Myxococcaceae bacterium]|nr:hypothetical protein [Myxococcaceae bacterium]
MRKGRSQRKTRGSLPPTSKRPQSRLANASPSSAGPQVVVGLTSPRSEDYSEALIDSSQSRSGREAAVPSAPSAKLELVEEAARLELVREQSLEIVRESLELVRESLEQEHEEHAGQEQHEDEHRAQHEARVETLTFDLTEASPFRRTGDVGDDEPVNAEATVPVKLPSHVTALPTPDEMSIPPMGDLSVEPIADRFFSEGELVAARADEQEEWDERANKAVRKSLPEVVQRRARFAKYVRWAVGGAAVVCLAALARTALPPSASSASASLATIEAPAAKAASVAIAAPEPVKTAEPVSAPVVAVPAQAAPAAEPAPAAAAPAAELTPTTPTTPTKGAEPAAVPADAPAAPAVAVSDKTALQEKNDSRRALERGKLADAIAAGERSVALDPTDGEAWLLLGAAYQEKGKNADARRCYSSCVKEGKRGPLGECRALIH